MADLVKPVADKVADPVAVGAVHRVAVVTVPNGLSDGIVTLPGSLSFGYAGQASNRARRVDAWARVRVISAHHEKLEP